MSQKFIELVQLVGLLAFVLGAFALVLIWALRRSAAVNQRMQDEYRAHHERSCALNERLIELQAEQNRLLANLTEALRECIAISETQPIKRHIETPGGPSNSD